MGLRREVSTSRDGADWIRPSESETRLQYWKRRDGFAGQILTRRPVAAGQLRPGLSIPRWRDVRSKWLSWTPESEAIEKGANSEPSKPTELGFDGFDGSFRADC